MKLKRFLSTILIGSHILTMSSISSAQDTFIPTPARPSDLIRIQQDADEGINNQEDIPTGNEERDTGDNEYELGQRITDYNNLIYTAFVIPQEDVEAFVVFVNTDENIINQIEIEEIESEEYDGQAYLAKYKESASEEGQPILFSAHTQYETIEKAADFAENTLLSYPDLFFDFEIYEVDGLYDVLLGIRLNVDTTVIWYDDDEENIKYNATRPSFTYQIEGSEEDPYQEIIEENFPDEFEFKSESVENNITEVTMVHVNSPYDQVRSQSEESMDYNPEETSEISLENDNDSNQETEASVASQSLEKSNTGFLGYRDNIMSLLNDRNITADNALIYLIGGFALLVGLLLIVVSKR